LDRSAKPARQRRPRAVITQRLLERDREAILIDGRRARRPGRLLRCHIAWCASRGAPLAFRTERRSFASQTEVDHTHPPIATNDRIVRLEVAVHQPCSMGGGKRLAGLSVGAKRLPL